MKSFLGTGKENRLSLDTYITSNSQNLGYGGKSCTRNTAILTCTLRWVSFTNLLLHFANHQESSLGWRHHHQGAPGCHAQLPGLQLSKQVWRIGEDSKQLHIAGSSK